MKMGDQIHYASAEEIADAVSLALRKSKDDALAVIIGLTPHDQNMLRDEFAKKLDISGIMDRQVGG